MTEQGHPWRGYFFIAAATFCWGAAVTFGKAIFNGSFFAGRALLSPMVITQARTSFTVLVLGTLLFLRYGRKIFRIGRNDLVLCALVGTLGVACSNYFYYLAVQMSTVSLAITVQYTAPVWVLLYMVARGKEKGTLRKALAVLIAIIGIALVIVLSDPKVSTVGPKAVLHSFLASLGTLGARAAFLASFGYAFYNVAGEGLVKRNHQFTITFYVLLSAALLWLVVNPPWRLVQQHFSTGQWEFLFLFACFSMVLPYMLYFSGLKYLDPTRAVITSCLEPVFAILFAVTFVHERLHPLQVAGIVAVLGATMMVQVQ
ncbi:MAG TPA: DMT family transporter, partial [Candidatus Sulfotelmatobacter sp.]|nr:DMT family transporter [Candidatus Sulfotelmatobacter sp.]